MKVGVLADTHIAGSGGRHGSVSFLRAGIRFGSGRRAWSKSVAEHTRLTSALRAASAGHTQTRAQVALERVGTSETPGREHATEGLDERRATST